MGGITFLSGSFIRKHTVVVGTPRCLCPGDLGSEARPVHPVEPLSFPAQPCPPSRCAPVPRAPVTPVLAGPAAWAQILLCACGRTTLPL